MKQLLLIIFLFITFASFGQKNDDEIYTTVEIQPEYPGGIKEMYAFIGKNIRCPESCIKMKATGRLIIKFVVEKEGYLNKIEVPNYFCKDLVLEIIRVMKLMPKWKAGMHKGKVVRFAYAIPIVDLCYE